MKVEWKHHQAESEVRPLLRAASRIDPQLATAFPRPIIDLVCAVFPVAFERHEGLRLSTIVQVLGDVYGIDQDALPVPDAEPVAGYCFARGVQAVIFSDPQYGEGFERFTQAHEVGHLFIEYLPTLATAGQRSLFGEEAPSPFYARRDSVAHIFLGGSPEGRPNGDRGLDGLRADPRAWRREVIANGFAAELLAPHAEVARLLTQLPDGEDPIPALRDRFGLSQRAAEVRLDDLGHFGPSGGARSLFE